MDALDARVAHAVEEMHADLALWLGTEAPPSVYQRIMHAQHPDFSMVGRDGDIVSREELGTELTGAANALPGMTIDIEDLTILASGGDVVVVRFTEIHRHSGTENRRRTTATLTADVSVEEGLRWLAVHETAIATG
ncbi:DUF4440 domain-containing protein [Stackebrandtia nassauensis]|uniref:DUF4440 domain-containing protein n=1 Tax=Stackebrandtia nassauensis (strain DSM 44728 / CIP 108903 / NRRL B-16338 / NBRC 102104 / LLR-40K-21) TaxID=446470 RepID=D3QAK8_STANL|nr:hypothetical protein [Stackebrandtia nassauensis]ADD42791.1 conserved hypothetical protein [Stackebrandtia nassauensis DSM 44728]